MIDLTKASASDVAALQELIPSQATSSNKLADKSFVNSSIATETAHYISNNGQPFISVAQLEAYSGTVTNNDYAFVSGTDEHGNTYYDRYKATVSGSTVSWAKEYRLNNSSFTAAQWAAISSGITSTLVGEISANTTARHTHSNKAVLDEIISAPYVKPSGGIPSSDMSSAVQTSLGKADSAIQDISGKADKVTSATSGNFAGLDTNGNLTDSGSKPSDFLTEHQDISDRQKIPNEAVAATGNFQSIRETEYDLRYYKRTDYDINDYQTKQTSAVNNNIAKFNSSGQTVDSGVSVNSILFGGDEDILVKILSGVQKVQGSVI